VMFNLTFPDTLKETNEPVQTGFSAPWNEIQTNQSGNSKLLDLQQSKCEAVLW
jgi:hypothetical protein